MKPFNYKQALKRAQSKHYRYEWRGDYGMVKVYSPDTFKWAMPWKPRKGVFEYKRRSRCTFDPNVIDARSYDWWQFVMVCDGKVIFNNYSYSHTTSSHQRMVRLLLKQLGIKIDIEVNSAPSLSNGLTFALEQAYKDLINARIAQSRRNAKPRTYAIKHATKVIKQLEALGVKFIDSKESIERQCQQAETRRLQRLKEQRKLKRKPTALEDTFYDGKAPGHAA